MKAKLKKEIRKFLKKVRVDEVELENKHGEFGWTDSTGVMRPSESGLFKMTIRGYVKPTK